ncbi:MAG: response regulator [Anaerolineae bacterium]|nr:response regulator [Anaerolineae bacterium]
MASIFVIEDNRMLRTTYVAGLTGFGYQVTEAETVQEAKDYLEGNEPDAILLDMQLPDGTGEEVIHYVRQDLQRMAVKIVVATGAEVDVDHLIALGADAVLQKPIEFSALFSALNK